MRRQKAKGFNPQVKSKLYGAGINNKGIFAFEEAEVPDDLVDHAFIIGDGDLLCNSAAIWQASQVERSSGQFPLSPILLSTEDTADQIWLHSNTPGHRFLQIPQGKPSNQMTVAIAYYATIVSLYFPALDPTLILRSKTAICDYWLALAPFPKPESSSILQKLNAIRLEMGQPPAQKKTSFFYVDAVAAFSDRFSPETPYFGIASLLSETFCKTQGVKALRWVAKNAGGIERGFLQDNWSIWSQYYQARIVPDHPLSEPMVRFLRKQDPSLLGTQAQSE